MNVRTSTCERTAQLVSLDLDGQLSYFERKLLAHHLARCPGCAGQARGTTAVTRLLRSAPLEPIELPSLAGRPRSARRVGGLLALAFVVSVVSLGAWLRFAPGAGQSPSELGGAAHRAALSAHTNDRFDWAAGPPRSTQIMQFVPGGRFAFSS